jgi:hypothetical protein
MVLLVCQSEQMPFVVAVQFTRRGSTDEAVKVLLVVGNNYAAADRCVTLNRHVSHPGDRIAIHGFGKVRCIHTETGRKHLGEYDQVGRLEQALDRCFELLTIAGSVVPGKIGLNDRDR